MNSKLIYEKIKLVLPEKSDVLLLRKILQGKSLMETSEAFDYDSQPSTIQKHLEQSFRTSFLQYKELLGNYMSQCLKVIENINGVIKRG